MRPALIILSLLFAGCITQERCLQRFPPTETTHIVYKDSTIVFYLPGQTIIDTVFVQVTDTVVYFESYLETEFCVSTIQMIEGKPVHRLDQREIIKDVVIQEVIKETVKEVTHTVREKYIGTWNRIIIWVGYAALAGLAFLLLFKRLR